MPCSVCALLMRAAPPRTALQPAIALVVPAQHRRATETAPFVPVGLTVPPWRVPESV